MQLKEIKNLFQSHPYHLVSPSPWPLYTSLSLFNLTTSFVMFIHGFEFMDYVFWIALINLVWVMSLWFRDIIAEGTFLGNHTHPVQLGLYMGVGLFIVSEVLFFLAIFWAFFHSSLSPNIELGGQWPPMGIQAINPFELPLLNTILLLSSGVTVTLAHHSFIAGDRFSALIGLILTVLLAILFTIFQYVEYSVSSFSISDGAYGSCFYFGTGFHGLISVALINYIIFILKTTDVDHTTINNDKLLINNPSNKESYYISKEFLEWLVGFTDGEGNFYIKITGLSENTFKSVQFTYQIGLHKDDEEVLNLIKNTLNCGHITRSNNKVNYFINDINSLLYVILPIFSYINLNSSKYHQFELFKKAVSLTKDKKHLSPNGKLNIIEYKKDMQKMSGNYVPTSLHNKIKITKFWLAGFIDGEGTFSTNKYVPRFKLENHVKEIELFHRIKEFLKVDNTLLVSKRVDRENSHPTIILEINKIKEIKDKVIPIVYNNSTLLLKSLKSKDFLLWLKLIDIYYKGYHTISEGKYVFDAIKLHINKYRLTTNFSLLENKQQLSISEIDNLLLKLYLLNSPYVIKQGVRYYRNTNNFVSEGVNIVVIDNKKNKTVYKSLTECANKLNIGRKKIKLCLDKGESYKGYTFVLS